MEMNDKRDRACNLGVFIYGTSRLPSEENVFKF